MPECLAAPGPYVVSESRTSPGPRTRAGSSPSIPRSLAPEFWDHWSDPGKGSMLQLQTFNNWFVGADSQLHSSNSEGSNFSLIHFVTQSLHKLIVIFWLKGIVFFSLKLENREVRGERMYCVGNDGTGKRRN